MRLILRASRKPTTISAAEAMRAIIMPKPMPAPPPRSVMAIITPSRARMPAPPIANTLYLALGISMKDKPIPTSDMMNVRTPPLWNPLDEALKPKALTVHQGKKTEIRRMALMTNMIMLGLVLNLIFKLFLLY